MGLVMAGSLLGVWEHAENDRSIALEEHPTLRCPL